MNLSDAMVKFMLLLQFSKHYLYLIIFASGLTGPKGDQGRPGIPGSDGMPGRQGLDGLKGEKGFSQKGNAFKLSLLFIKSMIIIRNYIEKVSFVTWKGDAGLLGKQGDKGDKGDRGTDGEKGDSNICSIPVELTAGFKGTAKKLMTSELIYYEYFIQRNHSLNCKFILQEVRVTKVIKEELDHKESLVRIYKEFIKWR